MFFSSDYFLFVIPGLILVMIAQWWVNSTHRKWSKIRNRSGTSGADAANSGLVRTAEERQGVNAVLTAAALTYIAALAAAVLQLLYYLSLVTRIGGRRRG